MTTYLGSTDASYCNADKGEGGRGNGAMARIFPLLTGFCNGTWHATFPLRIRNTLRLPLRIRNFTEIKGATICSHIFGFPIFTVFPAICRKFF